LQKFVAEVEAFLGLERQGWRGKHYKSRDGELVRARKNARQSVTNYNMATRNEFLQQNQVYTSLFLR